MRLLHLFLFLGLLAGPGLLLRTQAQAVPGFDRVALYGLPASGAGPGSYIEVRHTTVDTQGNGYVVGNFRDSVAFGGLSTPAASYGVRNGGFIAKLDANGAWTWFELLPETLTPYAVAVDAQGDLYLTGSFISRIVLTGTPLVALGFNDVFVAKFNGSTHRCEWAVRAGGQDAGHETGNAVVLSPAGALYVAGTYTSARADFGATTLTLPNTRGKAMCFLSRLDPQTGAWRWTTQGGYDQYDNRISGLTADATGAYLAGQYTQRATFGPLTLTNSPTGPVADVFVAKAAAGNGAWQWARGTESTTLPYSLAPGYVPGATWCDGLATDGRWVYLVGSTSARTCRFGTTTLNNLGPHPGFDAFVARLSAASGAWGWAVQGGSADTEGAQGIAVGAGGGRLYISGLRSGNSLSFLPATASGTGSLYVAELDTTAGAGRWVVVGGQAIGATTGSSLPTGRYTRQGGHVALDGQGRLHLASVFYQEPVSFSPINVAPTRLPTTYIRHFLARLSGGPLAINRGGPATAGGWTVYPNPASRGRAVSVVGLRSGQLVQVLDVLGREVARGLVPLGGEPLALTLPIDCATGLYLVRAAGQVRRLVVE